MKKKRKKQKAIKNFIITTFIAAIIGAITNFIFYWFPTGEIHLNYMEERETFVSSLNSVGITSFENNYNCLREGCILNSYIENITDKNIAISKYKLVIDSIKPCEIPTADIITICNNNQLFMYVVNNGNVKLENAKVQLLAYNSGLNGPTEITNEMLSSIINTQDANNEIRIPDINPGQILKFATFNMNPDVFDRYNETFGIMSISIYVKTFFEDDEKSEISENPLGTLTNNNGNLDIVLGLGGYAESIKRNAIIDPYKNTPYDISLHTEFEIESHDTEFLQTYIFTEKTCEPTFHLEIKNAGKDYIQTKPITQKIFIPLYDDSLHLYNIKMWIDKYNIENYCYNEDPILQQEIEYNPKGDYISQ